MRKISLLCATTALALPSMAFAQSTGSIEFEEDAIVVTGQRTQDAGGVTIPDSPKAKQVLTQEVLSRQTPGQTLLDTVNLIPGVSFQNNDPYGSSGGTLTIRGFSSDRISLTVDGVPLNDSGNYAIYSNQQTDPELIEQVNVNLGSTDVDSPTASAVGGTVNYRTRLPGRTLGGLVSASYGEWDFHRVLGMFDTGELTSFGTRAFVAASTATNKNPFNGFGRIRKQQYNARIHQPLSGDDFVSLTGHYNSNRNNFGGSAPLRTDLTNANGTTRAVGGGTGNRFPVTRAERFYDLAAPCQVAAARANLPDSPNSCGTEFDRRYNPSDTGRVNINSRFSLSDRLVLTIDPSYNYVKANGGGTVTGNERCLPLAGGRAPGQTFCGVINVGSGSGSSLNPTGGFGYYFGRDLNGDGDIQDTVTLISPSQTNTNRYVVVSSLAYDISDDHRARIAYTYDRARHRQTGEVGFVDLGAEPLDVFPVNDPIKDVNGNVVQKRDRLSFAILHKVSGEYRGSFMNDRLDVQVGLAAPFFIRELNQNCFTVAANGNVGCVSSNNSAAYAAANPTFVGPTSRTYKYDKLLPSVGFTFDVAEAASVFANYAKNISVPGTDPLYASLFFANTNQAARPDPETSDSFDGGIRYRSGRIQAQIAGWFTRYQNRLATSYDPELDLVIFRNLGQVDKYGVDASFGFEPMRNMVVYLFGSINDSEIKDDVQIGTLAGQPIFAPTRGKRESGAPTNSYGFRLQGALGPLELGAQLKRTGKRFVFDTNLPVFRRDGANDVQIYPAATPAYTKVDLDARYSLASVGLEKTYFQLNISNLFDVLHAGGFGGGLNQTITRNAAGAITGYGNPPFVQIGAPRAISGSLVIGF